MSFDHNTPLTLSVISPVCSQEQCATYMGVTKDTTQTQTQQISDDIKAAADDALDDYEEAVKADLEQFKNAGGISFKGAADGIKSAVLSHIPQPNTCQNIEFTYLGTTKNLDCEKFETFKIIMAWFLSIITIIYIFKLAIRPVGV